MALPGWELEVLELLPDSVSTTLGRKDHEVLSKESKLHLGRDLLKVTLTLPLVGIIASIRHVSPSACFCCERACSLRGLSLR